MDRVLSFEEGMGNLLDIIINIQEKSDQDFLILVGGGEGSGKSTFVLDCVDYIDDKRGMETPIDNIAFSIKAFARAMAKAKKKEILDLDEGRELQSQLWQTKEQKEFKKAMTQVRKAGHIIFVSFPNPLSMTNYVRADKTWATIIINKHGLASVYSRDNFAKVMDKVKIAPSLVNILKQRANFMVRFDDYTGRLRKAYDNKKDKEVHYAKQAFSEALGSYDGEEENENLIRTAEAARMCGVSHNAISDWVAKGWLVAQRLMPDGSPRFEREKIKEFIKGMEKKAANAGIKAKQDSNKAPSDISDEKKPKDNI